MWKHNWGTPLSIVGAGRLREFWVDRKKKFDALSWNHHMRVNGDMLVIDGVEFYHFGSGSPWNFEYEVSEDEFSSSMSESD